MLSSAHKVMVRIVALIDYVTYCTAVHKSVDESTCEYIYFINSAWLLVNNISGQVTHDQSPVTT